MHPKRKFLAYPHVIYKKSEIESPEGHNLKTAEWAVLTQVDGQKSLEDIAVILASDLRDIIRMMQTLHMERLVEVAKLKKPEPKYVSESFFKDMEQALTSIVGPVAPYVIEDTLADNEFLKTNILKEQVPELIELVSEEISDEDKKVMFQAQMLNYIKNKLD